MSSKIEVSRELLKEFIDLSIQGRSGDWVNLRNDLRALLAAPVVERQPVEKSQWDVAPNPVLGYADSYRQMARTGTKSIDVWSIITDLERNIAPLFAAPPELAEYALDQWWLDELRALSVGQPTTADQVRAGRVALKLATLVLSKEA